MILQQTIREIHSEGEVMESQKMHVSREAENHLIRMATEWSYKQPLESGLREAVSNAVDSHLESGNTDPVIVKLAKNKVNQWVLEIIDEGLGLDDTGFHKYIMGIGESTKRGRADLLGGYGAGAKAFISYVPQYEYICRKDGIERKYLIFKGDEIPESTLIYENETFERNGVKVSVTLNSNYGEYDSCIRAIKQQLSYLDNVAYDIQGFDNSFKIFRNDLFAFNSLQAFSEMHICLKGIYYPINWQKLGITRLNIPVALKFDEYEFMQPVFNREDLIWSSKSITAVKKRIAEVADWFVEKYNAELKEPITLVQAWESLGMYDKKVNIIDKVLIINELEPYSLHSIEDIKVKGCYLIKANWYKYHYNDLISKYKVIGEYTNSTLKTKFKSRQTFNLIERGKNQNCLLHEDDMLSGYFREYIKTLGLKTFLKVKTDIELDSIYYDQLLDLSKYTQEDRKLVIQEFCDMQDAFCADIMTDGTMLSTSTDFQDFRAALKTKPKSKKATSLNKQRGDVTIAYGTNRLNSSAFCFKKATFAMENLYKSPYLSIIIEDDDIISLDILQKVYEKQKLKFCKIGVQDRKKIDNLKLHNFMTLKNLEKTKAFSRTVTAMYAKSVVDDYEALTYCGVKIIGTSLSKLGKLYQDVKAYATSNCGSLNVKNEFAVQMFTTAREFNLWDQEYISTIQKLENGIKDFEFINLLATNIYDKVKLDKINTFIYQTLLFKKYKYPETLQHLEIKNK